MLIRWHEMAWVVGASEGAKFNVDVAWMLRKEWLGWIALLWMNPKTSGEQQRRTLESSSPYMWRGSQ